MALNDIFVRALQSLKFREKEEEDKKKIIDSLEKPIYNEREFDDSSAVPNQSNDFVNALKGIRQFAKEGVGRVKTAFQNDPDQFNLYAQMAKGNVATGIEPLDFIPRTGSQYIQNRIVKPIEAIPENVKTVKDPNAPLLQRGAAGVATVGALIPGVDDIPFAAYDAGKAKLANKSLVKGFTGEEYTGLGEAVASGSAAEQPLNLAEIPLALATGSVMAKKQAASRLAGAAGVLEDEAPAIKTLIENLDDTPVTQAKSAFSYTPATQLDEASRSVEQKFGKYLTENFDTAESDYKQMFGNVLNTDNARELSDDYNANRSALSPAVHEPASSFIKKVYEKRLSEAPGPGQENTVLFTAGGTGAGKTTAINTKPEFKTTADKAQIVYDTNLSSFDSSKQKIEQALAAGKDVKILYVLRDPLDALVNGAIPRSQRMGRTVPIDAHVSTHVGALDTVKKLASEYATNSKVDIGVIDNSYGRGGARVIPLESLKNVSYNASEVKQNVEQTLNQLYADKKISPEIYKGFSGKDAPETQSMGAGDGGQSQQINKAVQLGEDQKLRSTAAPNFEASLKYYETPDDVKKTIESIANEGIEGIQTARRGAITFKETRAMADALGMDVKDLEKRKPGSIWNAEQADAATRLMIGVNEKLTTVGSQIRQLKQSGEEIPEALQLQQMDLAAQAQAVTASILGDNAEAGRALNIRKMLKQALETNDSKAKKQAMKMFGGDEDRAKEVIAKLSEFEPDDNLGRAKFLRSVKPSTGIEKIEEFWYNSVLSNTATHIVNSISNSMGSLLSIPEKVVAGALDTAGETGAKILGKAYKRDRYAAEAAAEVSGIVAGIKKGLRKGGYVLRNGVSEADVSKMEIGRAQAIKGPIGNVINIPSRALVAEDEFFKGINYEMELRALALRKAKQEGLTGPESIQRIAELTSEPTPQMVSAAMEKAKYKAFQADSNLADALRTARDKITIKLPGGNEFRPLRFIIPFIQTPVNVVKYGLERSPAGLVGTAHKLVTGAPKAEILDSAARASLGTAAMVPLAMYFTEGKITGAPPKDRTERDAFYADGKLPYSVKIGDEWVAYNRIEPLNTILTQIAMWHDASKDGEQTTVEQISNFMRAEARNIADQTFMTGVGNLVDAIEDPERYGQKFLTDILGGFVPSLAAAGARATDDTVRLPKTVQESLLARVPGMSQNVPAQESEIEPGGVAVRHTNEGMLRNVLSNFGGFRSSRDQGTNYQEQVQAMKSADKETRDRKEEVKTTAQDILQQVKDTPPEERAALVEQKIVEGSLTNESAKILINQVKEEAKVSKMDVEAKLLKDYPNESKARYMYDKLKALPVEDREAWVSSMLEQQVISEGTVEELAKLIQASKTNSTVQNSLLAP